MLSQKVIELYFGGLILARHEAIVGSNPSGFPGGMASDSSSSDS